MNKIEIENEILRNLYHHWENHSGNTIYAVLDKLEGVKETSFERIAEVLQDAQFIKDIGRSENCKITPLGIIEAEKRELIDSDKVQLHEKIRFQILKAAFDSYELEGNRGEFSINELIENQNLDKFAVFKNASFLKDLGFINSASGRSYSSTALGRKNFKNWEQQNFLNQELTRILELKPQKRGVELQKLIAKAVEFAGWQQEESVKTSYEEMDVIIYQKREFYLVECKWEKDPIGTPAVTHLRDKLNRRMGTNGILMSMSGFASTSCRNIEESTGQNLILLFGKEDIETLISNPGSFELLLDEKYKELVMRRKVIWK